MDFRGEPGDVPERIPVSLGRAGFACTAVHAAAPFALHHGRAARSAGAGLGAAKRPREHREGNADELKLPCGTSRHAPTSELSLLSGRSASCILRCRRAASGPKRSSWMLDFASSCKLGLVSEQLPLGGLDRPTLRAPIQERAEIFFQLLTHANETELKTQAESSVRVVKQRKAGAPDTIRTCDLCLRRATLYPAELRVQWGSFSRLAGSGQPLPPSPARLICGRCGQEPAGCPGRGRRIRRAAVRRR
jgi:hypothetical protein